MTFTFTAFNGHLRLSFDRRHPNLTFYKHKIFQVHCSFKFLTQAPSYIPPTSLLNFSYNNLKGKGYNNSSGEGKVKCGLIKRPSTLMLTQRLDILSNYPTLWCKSLNVNSRLYTISSSLSFLVPSSTSLEALILFPGWFYGPAGVKTAWTGKIIPLWR